MSDRPAGPAGGMGRVQLFEIRLSHGRIVYSPGEPLAGAVHVCLGAPLPFRGGRGSPWGGPGGVSSGGCGRSWGWAGTPGSAADVAESGPLPSPLARPGARMGATRVPRVLGVLGGRRAAFGAEQGGLGGPVFRFCPSCPLRPGEGWEPVHFGRAHWDLDTGKPPTLPARAPGATVPRTCWALPGRLRFLSHTPGSCRRQSHCRVCGFPAGPTGHPGTCLHPVSACTCGQGCLAHPWVPRPPAPLASGR